MKQILQNLKSGETFLAETPAPADRQGHVRIKSTCSLVSAGTERMLIDFGRSGFIGKAKAQPDKVKQVLDKIRTDGLIPTIEAVFRKLDTPIPMGYCNVGAVRQNAEHGMRNADFQIGERVVSNGPHAEIVAVPERLCAKIPDTVSDEEATFAVLASVGLQGIKLADAKAGERVVVYGLGLIGLLSVQILRARGCKVFGIDINAQRLKLAEKFGATVFDASNSRDPVPAVLNWADNTGAHAVLITASAKKDNIVHNSTQMCRKHGRIVLVGVVDLNLRRSDFYEKELTFQVSCSYGPDRHKEANEKEPDQWTVRDNLETVLGMMAEGLLDVKPLITHRFDFKNASEAYRLINEDRSALGVILKYGGEIEQTANIKMHSAKAIDQPAKTKMPMVGVIGAGNFARATLLPAFKNLPANLKYIASAGGLSAATLAKRSGATHATSDYREILKDDEVDLVIITTRHDLHAPMVIEALKAGKHVFVEKPLCLNEAELAEIIQTVDCRLQTVDCSCSEGLTQRREDAKLTTQESNEADCRPLTSDLRPPSLTVGFNRRFAPLAVKMKAMLGEGPKNIIATMNAGAIPPEVWVHDLEVGGGRIIGEACHYIDLCSFLSGSLVTAVCMNAMGLKPQENTDNASILLRYANGTNAVINYFANGSKSYAKERIEVYVQEKSFVLDNWRELLAFGVSGFSKMKSKQDKGHKAQFDLLVKRVNEGGCPLIPFNEIVNTTRASFAAIASLREGRWVTVE